jgi:hypothetical protein
MSQLTPHIPGKVTASGRDRCRFDLFIRKKPHFVKPGQKPEWCHRGDVYTQEANRMLINLVRMFANHWHEYVLAELYDNTRPINDPQRIVLRYKDGTLETNNLNNYPFVSELIALPTFLIPSHENKTD